MPPVHPAVVHFPIALGIGSVTADSAGGLGAGSQLFATGRWSIAAAALAALLAAAAGYRDMKADQLRKPTHELVHLHRNFGAALTAALVGLALWRWSIVTPGVIYVIAGWAVVALILFQAWLGGELVYAHGAGVAPTGQGTADAAAAQRPSRVLFHRFTGRSLGPPDAQSGSR